jgi:L-2-hydroxyglutarate oxidase LhgO
METSSRNTECIHAGIYYQSDTLKAKLCKKGRERLYSYCSERNIPHKKTGKIFVATSEEEIKKLKMTLEQAQRNGLSSMRLISKEELSELEPNISAIAGLLSPESGIVNSHILMEKLLAEAVKSGTIFAPNSPLEQAEFKNGHWELSIGGLEPIKILSDIVINSAGLYAIEIAKKVFPEKTFPQLRPTKGCYLRYKKKSPISHIIYPAMTPSVITERVDATPDIAGFLRFGPNSEPVEHLQDYKVSEDLIKKMLPGIRTYLPQIKAEDIQIDMAGIRPRIYSPGEKPVDFYIQWDQQQWLNLIGMESPALTSCLAIGDYVADEIMASK